MGAFNRAYQDWDLLIETYDLPYDKVGDDRYHLVGATAAAGMGPVQGADGFVYSHHANDPAYGTTCSAWDLVRLHRFGDMDEDVPSQTPPNRRPSHAAMADLATQDNRAMAEMVGIDFAEAFDDEGNANDWRLNLRRNNRGVITNVVANRDLIRDNDPALKVMYLNEMSMVIEADADLPWRKVHAEDNVIDKADRAEFLEYLSREYGLDIPENFAERMINIAGSRRRRHPAREYLQSLRWDGVSRIETALPGVRPTPYTRMVSRKILVAAAARVLQPGVKWDHTLVLFGSEGLGKSWWIERMSKGWSASLGRIGDKDTLMALRAAWIITADEGHSLRKSDNDALKEFITRTHDTFRAPYDPVMRRHARHCVIWATTNDEVFLRRQEGNRRYLIVRSEDKVDFDAVTDEYVDQIWAEAVALWDDGQGERLYLDGLESLEAAEQREHFIEEDAYGGIIEGYLSLPVPENWAEMNVDKRREWMFAFREGMESEGSGSIDEVCTAQIWVEAMDRRKGDAKRTDLIDIYNALLRLPDWERVPGRTWLNRDYGNQTVFRRKKGTGA
jgi:predicted P-loop ATPase